MIPRSDRFTAHDGLLPVNVPHTDGCQEACCRNEAFSEQPDAAECGGTLPEPTFNSSRTRVGSGTL